MQRQKIPVPVLVLFSACLLPELVLTLGEFGLFDGMHRRGYAIGFGGFWPGVMGSFPAAYPGQPFLMFVTHGFLHAGFVHFGLNMLALIQLGTAVVARTGTFRFIIIYIASMIGGAAAYYVLSDGYQPMIGASGAIYGLLGAFFAWEWKSRRAGKGKPLSLFQIFAVLVVLNLVLWWLMGGNLAWQAHLGGAVVGFLVQALAKPRRFADFSRD